ncbi:uncharacterized protein TNCV_734341 [Trichonephila clavipes]|nr:uncharacterized protein TNCV_734341 [Trichonephila clavipes]
MPENKWLEFENFKFNLPVPYTIYADFESLIVKINSCAPDPERSSTVPIANHIPCGYAYVVIGPDGSFKKPPVVYRGENAEKTDLMLHKGIYPYEYMDTFQKFNEGCLPSKEAFFSSLTNETVSDDDYAHCQNVWKSFNLKTLGEYHDLYVTSDVILLADVFQNFRHLCLNFYKLDPCHCYTAPGLAWQACLYMSRVKLELFTDLDMHLFVERGIRGGISMISHRFSSANNKYLDSYDENKPSKYILYLDANNLYGWAMSQPLPTHGFEWITQPIDFMEIPDESDIGYILEVDMDYPQNLHNLHNDYPLAPETLNVTNDMLSPYCKEIAQEHNLNTNSCTKLVPNLMSKKGYIVHYRNLKQYVSLGLKATKIHKVLKFHQRPWLKNILILIRKKEKTRKAHLKKKSL